MEKFKCLPLGTEITVAECEANQNSALATAVFLDQQPGEICELSEDLIPDDLSRGLTCLASCSQCTLCKSDKVLDYEIADPTIRDVFFLAVNGSEEAQELSVFWQELIKRRDPLALAVLERATNQA